MDTSRLSSVKEDWVALDKLLLSSVLLLVCWGIACIFSAGSGNAGRGGEYALRQLGWGLLSCAAYFVVIIVGYRKFMDLAYHLRYDAPFIVCHCFDGT